MAYTVSTDDGHELIDVRYRGCVSIGSRIQAMNETLVLLDSTGYRRIMVDYLEAKAHLDSLASASAFASLISSDPQLRQCRITFVGSRTQQFNAVVETLADARHYPFKRFYDRASALAWLLSSASRFEPAD
ncbi:MAG: hypothetical protein KY442_00155 [Proteobacteria bacterium]|nr:hypothetical protein [Pseudomonadota bacterium]